MKTQTKNSHLQNSLNQWMEMLTIVHTLVHSGNRNNMSDRQIATDRFVRSFVPSDVTEDDISHYATNLLTDDVSHILHFVY